MKRITPKIKAIADAHLEAKRSGIFDNPRVTTKEEVIEALLGGKTLLAVLEEIEIRFCSVGSLLMASHFSFGHHSNNYKANVYKGFKILLNNYD